MKKAESLTLTSVGELGNHRFDNIMVINRGGGTCTGSGTLKARIHDVQKKLF